MCTSAKAINPTVFRWRDPAIPSSVSGKTRKAFKNQMAVPYATPLKKGGQAASVQVPRHRKLPSPDL